MLSAANQYDAYDTSGAIRPDDAVGGEASSSGLLEARFVGEVIPHSAYLLGHALGFTKQRADAEDLVQDAMLKAYVSFSTFREGSNVKSWLYRILVNTWVDKHRSSLRRPDEQLSDGLTDRQMASQARLGGGLPSAEAEALRSVLSDAEAALRELPVELREIVYYADVRGYRNTEVAEMLHIPVGTVGSRLFRGRRQLRERLSTCEHPEDGDRRQSA